MLGRFIVVPSTLTVVNVPPAGPGRLNGCAPAQVGSATPSAPKMRPAIIRSRISRFVPARRFCVESPSCDAASLICTAFLKVVSAPPTTSSMTVVDTSISVIVKPSSREILNTIVLYEYEEMNDDNVYVRFVGPLWYVMVTTMDRSSPFSLITSRILISRV